MLDVSLGEMAIILLVAVLVIGPKELPTVVRHITDWIRQIRAISQQITSQFSALDKSGEIQKLRNELQEQAKFIRDAEGNLYRTYDISDLATPTSPEKPAVLDEGEQHHAATPPT